MLKRLLLLAVPAIALSVPASPLAGQTAVTNLDETRLVGSWYEIARLPNRQQKACTADSVELISRYDKPGSLEWLDACTVKGKYNQARNLYAHPVPKRNAPGGNGNGEYKVYTIFPFSKKYLILAVAPDNSWLLVGTPNHKELWIYAKSPVMTPEVLAAVKAQASGQGYPTGKLILQPQTKPLQAIVASGQ